MMYFGHTITWDKIEILKEMDGWYKIRTKEGNVGFIENKEGTVLDELPKLISGISYVNGQKAGYTSASEIISALMLLQYKNKRTTINEIIKHLNIGSGLITNAATNTLNGGNPYEEFLGKPTNNFEDGTYGSYADPIVEVMNKITRRYVQNSSNMTEEELYNNINESKPVIVWLGEKYDPKKETPKVWKDRLRK